MRVLYSAIIAMMFLSGLSAAEPDALGGRIAAAAKRQIGVTVKYDPAYVQLKYPAGRGSDSGVGAEVCLDGRSGGWVALQSEERKCMRITWNELLVGFEPETSDAFLDDWRWLVGENVQLLLVSAMGDLFLEDERGHILWLETGAAQIKDIANSVAEFKGLMQQRDFVEEWFVPQCVGDLIVSGKRLAPGQCYSYILPPMLDGKLELKNLEPASLLVHCSMFGQIGKQIRDLPEGTKINEFNIKGFKISEET